MNKIKQHITPKQALEITESQFYGLFSDIPIVHRKDWAHYHHKKITIGKMIEILENNLPTLHIDKHLKQGLNTKDYYEVFQQSSGSYIGNNLCDALWDAVKYSLLKEYSKC